MSIDEICAAIRGGDADFIQQQIMDKLRSMEARLKAADELADVVELSELSRPEVYSGENRIKKKLKAYRNAGKGE